MSVYVEGYSAVGNFGLLSAPQLGTALCFDDLYRFVSKRVLRRVDKYSKMALMAGYLALENAGLRTEDISSEGLVLATAYGATSSTYKFLDSVIDGGDALASPMHFSNSVDNSAAAYLSINMQITGPCLTVAQSERSVSTALATAYQWLTTGRVAKVLFAAVDENSPVREYSWAQRYGHTTQNMGEGAACFVLAAEASDKSCFKIDFEGFQSYGFDVFDKSAAATEVASAGDRPLQEKGFKENSGIYGHQATAFAFDLALALEQGQGTTTLYDFDSKDKAFRFKVSAV